MFHPGSRYADAGTYQVTRPGGAVVTATRLPLPPTAPVVLGWQRRADGERLDLLAAHFLGDPTASWALGFANAAMVLDALAARPLVAVPRAV
jgi:hypothetical protein